MNCLKVVELNIYPVKSCQGISLEEGEVTAKGFRDDREWMIVDERGLFITQRQVPQLALIQVKREGEFLVLSHPQRRESLTVPRTFKGEEMTVEVWGDRLTAIDTGKESSLWLQTVLGIPKTLHLVRQSPHILRPVDPHYTTIPNHPVSFADGYPFLITNTASLTHLNQHLQNHNSPTIPMTRFRPNIVIAGNEPFAEDDWKNLQIGEITFDLVKPCSRCIVTTTDQQTGIRNPNQEPLKTLSTFRLKDGKILFGENAIPRSTGLIKIGDDVVV